MFATGNYLYWRLPKVSSGGAGTSGLEFCIRLEERGKYKWLHVYKVLVLWRLVPWTLCDSHKYSEFAASTASTGVWSLFWGTYTNSHGDTPVYKSRLFIQIVILQVERKLPVLQTLGILSLDRQMWGYKEEAGHPEVKSVKGQRVYALNFGVLSGLAIIL